MEYHSGKQTNDFEYTVRKPKSQANPVLTKYFINGISVEWCKYVEFCTTEMQNRNKARDEEFKKLRLSAPPRPPAY